MKKTDKIYVAGHTGLIGSAIARRLEKDGYTNVEEYLNERAGDPMPA